MHVYKLLALFEKDGNDQLTDNAKIKNLELSLNNLQDVTMKFILDIEQILLSSTTNSITTYALLKAYRNFDSISYDTFTINHGEQIYHKLRNSDE